MIKFHNYEIFEDNHSSISIVNLNLLILIENIRINRENSDSFTSVHSFFFFLLFIHLSIFNHWLLFCNHPMKCLEETKNNSNMCCTFFLQNKSSYFILHSSFHISMICIIDFEIFNFDVKIMNRRRLERLFSSF